MAGNRSSSGIGRRVRWGVFAVALMVATTVFAVRIASTKSVGMGGSVEVAGPVPWVLLEVGSDRRSLTILPIGERSECGFSWGSVEKVPNPTIELRASIRRQGCETEVAMAYAPEVVTVQVPGPRGVMGQRVDGPLYRGAASTEQLRTAAAGERRRAYPNVEGLRLSLATEILKAHGAEQAPETVGPATDTSFVGRQWPAPGTPIAPWRGRDLKLPVEPLERGLLVTYDPRLSQKSQRARFTCRQAAQLPADDRERFARAIPRSC